MFQLTPVYQLITESRRWQVYRAHGLVLRITQNLGPVRQRKVNGRRSQKSPFTYQEQPSVPLPSFTQDHHIRPSHRGEILTIIPVRHHYRSYTFDFTLRPPGGKNESYTPGVSIKSSFINQTTSSNRYDRSADIIFHHVSWRIYSFASDGERGIIS